MREIRKFIINFDSSINLRGGNSLLFLGVEFELGDWWLSVILTYVRGFNELSVADC